MRRWCMPGGGAAPSLLQRTEAGRTEGVDAFEGRKVGIGVMEVDARDGLGGRGGGLPEAAAVKIRVKLFSKIFQYTENK